MNHKNKKFISIISIIVIFVGYCIYVWKPSTSQNLSIYMLNVGQGDSFYIRTPKGNDILIDGGPNRSVLSELGEVMPPYDRELELVIATHPDADHIAGLTELPDQLKIHTLFTNGTETHTPFFESLAKWEKKHHIQVYVPYRGMRFDVEEGVWLEFLHPNPQAYHQDVNDDSIMFILHYNQFSALFTGDAPKEIEEEVVEHYSLFGITTVDIDLLKVGHHGSKTSTSRTFLQATTPEVSLISVGADNTFGHPNAGVVARLQRAGIQVFRTDIQGKIFCTSDGFQFFCQPEQF
ncbi:MAG TPA: ComEC/Rec2 family competence protein [Patescibacteria group bacterium]|nr:ComEC/Rec2 family competence protein [Patescibacteria group bacterium]